MRKSIRKSTLVVSATIILIYTLLGVALGSYFSSKEQGGNVFGITPNVTHLTPDNSGNISFTPQPKFVPGTSVTYTTTDYGSKATSGGYSWTDAQHSPAAGFDFATQRAWAQATIPLAGSSTPYAYAEIGKSFVSGGNGRTIIGCYGHYAAHITITGLAFAKITFGWALTDTDLGYDILYDMKCQLYKAVAGSADCNADFNGGGVATLVNNHNYVMKAWVRVEANGLLQYCFVLADAQNMVGGVQFGIKLDGVYAYPIHPDREDTFKID